MCRTAWTGWHRRAPSLPCSDDDPGVIGIAFKWNPERVLYVADAARDRLRAAAPGRRPPPFHAWRTARVDRLAGAAASRSIWRPRVPEIANPRFASHTTLAGGSDLYVANRGDGSLVRLSQDGRAAGARRDRGAGAGRARRRSHPRHRGLGRRAAHVAHAARRAARLRGARRRADRGQRLRRRRRLRRAPRHDRRRRRPTELVAGRRAEPSRQEFTPQTGLGPLFNARSAWPAIPGPGGASTSEEHFARRVARMDPVTGRVAPIDHPNSPIARRHSTRELGQRRCAAGGTAAPGQCDLAAHAAAALSQRPARRDPRRRDRGAGGEQGRRHQGPGRTTSRAATASSASAATAGRPTSRRSTRWWPTRSPTRSASRSALAPHAAADSRRSRTTAAWCAPWPPTCARCARRAGARAMSLALAALARPRGAARAAARHRRGRGAGAGRRLDRRRARRAAGAQPRAGGDAVRPADRQQLRLPGRAAAGPRFHQALSAAAGRGAGGLSHHGAAAARPGRRAAGGGGGRAGRGAGLLRWVARARVQARPRAGAARRGGQRRLRRGGDPLGRGADPRARPERGHRHCPDHAERHRGAAALSGGVPRRLAAGLRRPALRRLRRRQHLRAGAGLRRFLRGVRRGAEYGDAGQAQQGADAHPAAAGARRAAPARRAAGDSGAACRSPGSSSPSSP